MRRDFVPCGGRRIIHKRTPPSGRTRAARMSEDGRPFAGFPGARAMLKRAGSALVFVAGSVIGGLALAFLVVALRPDLIRATPRPPEPDTDLAVLKIDLTQLPGASFGRSDQLLVGDVVLAIGNPIGLRHTVTHGIVSATSRQQLGIAPLEDFIQTDAPINFGNSGGALIDSSGALVGINTAIVAKNLGVEGIGFAIPVNMVRGVLSEIIAHGRVIRGWIGIVPQDVPEEQARQFGLPQPGVLIEQLYLGSPALQAGLRPGDLLLAIDGTTPA